MKKLGLTICALLCGLYLGACADTAVAENAQNKLFSINYKSAVDYYYTSGVLIDNETGINYIIVTGAGTGGGSCAITPRLNTDGSLYISK